MYTEREKKGPQCQRYANEYSLVPKLFEISMLWVAALNCEGINTNVFKEIENKSKTKFKKFFHLLLLVHGTSNNCLF